MIKHSVALGGTLILIAIAGPLIWSRYIREDFVISVTAFAIGIVSFFGIANMRPSASGPVVLRGETLRTAIACSLITSYLFIVCFTTFVKTSQSVGGVTEEFVKSFSNIVGITIAFYFGASSVAQIFAKGRRRESEEERSEKNH